MGKDYRIVVCPLMADAWPPAAEFGARAPKGGPATR